MQNEAEAQRKITKQEISIDRGGPFYARCDFCGRPNPSHMHELIYRSASNRHTEARDLTYRKELCSLLCVVCHNAVHSGTGIDQDQLWRRNYSLYGYENVVQAFEEVEAALKYTLGIILPEEN